MSQNHLRLLILMGILLNLELNFLNVRMPLNMSALGQGAAGYGLFESLLAGGALTSMSALYLAGPRLSLYNSLGLGNLLVALGCTSLLVDRYSVLLGGGTLVGLGLGLIDVSGITLLQLMAPPGLRGQTLGGFMGASALGLVLGAGLGGIVFSRTMYPALGFVTLVLTMFWYIATKPPRTRT